MVRTLLILAVLQLLACGAPQSVAHLSWDAPTKNVDGTAITGPLTYTVYRGASSTSLTAIATVSVQTYNDAAGPGTWVYAVSATAAGVKSANSDAISTALANSQTSRTGTSP